MGKAILIILLVVGAIVGGLLALRSSARTGLPEDEVMKRAQRRADEQRKSDDD